MTGRTLKKFVLIFVSGLLFCLWLESTSWFRLERLEFDIRNHNYDHVDLVTQILRKEKAVGAPESKLSSLNAKFTNVFVQAALETKLRTTNHLQSSHWSWDSFHSAMAEYEKILAVDRDYRILAKAVSLTVGKEWEDALRRSMDEKRKICLRMAGQLIREEKWGQARDFTTKKILKYLNPVEVLELLNVEFNAPSASGIREKIWGDAIYVVLEDFEDTDKPVLSGWSFHAFAEKIIHKISKDVFHKGSRSEYFDLTYRGEGWDYWIKDVDIPLSGKALPVGIRIFIKSEKPFQGALHLATRHGKDQDKEGIWQTDQAKDAGRGWQMRWIGDLFAVAQTQAKHTDSPDLACATKVIVNTRCDSNQFYVDDIELFLFPPQGT